MMTLRDELRSELERCRRLLADYVSLGSVGVFGTALVEEAIRRSEGALRRDDSRRMQQALADLRRFHALGPVAPAANAAVQAAGVSPSARRWSGPNRPQASPDNWVVNAA